MIFLSKKPSAAAAYTRNVVNNQGTGNLRGFNNGTTPGAFTLSANLRPDVSSGTQRLLEISGRVFIGISNSLLSVTIRNSANSDCYGGGEVLSTSAVFADATWGHLYISGEFLGDGAGTSDGNLIIQANGSNVPMNTDVSAFSSSNNAVNFNRAISFLSNESGGWDFNGHIADMMLFDSVVSNTTLYNGGTPPDPDALATTPVVLMGGAMTADERSGNTAQGWNDFYNAGSGGNFTTGSATFVDV